MQGKQEDKIFLRASREALHATLDEAEKNGLFPFVDPSKKMESFSLRPHTPNKVFIRIRIAGRARRALTYQKFFELAEATQQAQKREPEDI